ncbi:uncharacterized protein LOC6037037 [Culex quinquefasciatus]|uniref:uncharacterized protein LOC6037037 n=1 Tax=Culex quinquefasciatus TaxID=7176 RepID=UPI0018E31627|nr:uncharacterized protein LOC6037037 [Culex quinquefasciatus]
MMDPSTVVPSGEMDFSAFVLDLNQSPKIDCTAVTGTEIHRCCAPESRLSAEFENKMQKLITNFDLDDDLGMPAMRFSDPEPVLNDELDGTILADRDYPIESLDTTVDNEDDPLNLTADDCDDSGDAGCSSDEQQQESRSLSLSYSISHAQENFSQYSQSTGLSKRYDSPCSYEDDRESEGTNFDKLDDWSDLISGLYHFCQEEQQTAAEKRNKDSRPDTPALERKAKGQHNYLDYRDPGLADFDDDAMMQGAIDDNSNVLLMTTTTDGVGVFREQGISVKRKMCEDKEDCERRLELIVEKFQKTDIVPDRGQHARLLDEQTFTRWCQIDSTPTPVLTPSCMDADAENQTDDEKLVMLDGEEDATDSPVATTPTNPRNMQRLFRTLANEEDGLGQADETLEQQLASESDSQLFTKQRYQKKLVGKIDPAQSVAGSSRKTLKLPLMKQQK